MRATTWVGMAWISWLCVACSGAPPNEADTDEEEIGAEPGAMGNRGMHASRIEMLGRHIFFDENLSQHRNQSCAACHTGTVGWTGSNPEVNAAGGVYEGSVAGRFGNRKPPASAYATLAPAFKLDPEAGLVGGNFWDGRATGWERGQPAADQATGPFLNPVEQALPDASTLVQRVCSARYGGMFRRVWGASACRDTDYAFDKIAVSIAAFEGSPAVTSFSSKYDAFIAGRAQLDGTEQLGLSLFRGKARCNNCHSADPAAGRPAAFTDFTYDNLGVPRNPDNPFYQMDKVFVDGAPINPLGEAFVDDGVGGFLAGLASSDEWRSLPHVTEPLRTASREELRALATANRGKQKVPTLRNVDKRPAAGVLKAYMHNGYFKTLEALVHFYNTRDVLPRCEGPATAEQAMAQACWPAPEVAENVNSAEVGDLGLTPAEEAAIVAFMRTLSDGFRR